MIGCHTGDGPVSLGLEWNGYKVIFGGDTAPNIWYPEYAKDADLAIHECWMTSDQMMYKYNQPAELALRINLLFPHVLASTTGAPNFEWRGPACGPAAGPERR